MSAVETPQHDARQALLSWGEKGAVLTTADLIARMKEWRDRCAPHINESPTAHLTHACAVAHLRDLEALPPFNAAVLYRYTYKGATQYGITRAGAVLGADPFCRDEKEQTKAVPCAVTDDGHGADAAIFALGFVLDVGTLEPEKYAPVFSALMAGKYATAVQTAEKLGLLK